MMNNSMIPQYSTITFTDVWDDVTKFKTDYEASPFKGAVSNNSPDNVAIIFYLLYARYGNNPIANRDINQWKFKIFSIIYQFGPTWEKRLEIQEKLRNLSDDEILKGAKAIYNHAYNPSTNPSTSSLDELNYINDQNISSYKKSKMDAYMQLWELLKVDVSDKFLQQFKKCFKIFVSAEHPLLYVEEEEV